MKLNVNNLLKQFTELSPRERLLSVVVTVAVLFYSVYLLFFAPIAADKSVLEQKIKAQQQTYQYLKNMSAEVTKLSHQQPKTEINQQGQSLMAIIDASSMEMDIKPSIKRMVPDETDSVTVWIENASFDQFIEWMAVLDAKYGIAVKQLSVAVEQANKDSVSIKVMLNH